MSLILVADDVEPNRDMLARRLTRRGHTVRTTADGPATLAALRAEDFDLVLLDVMMPGMSGLEVLRSIRETHSLAMLPVVMVTAKDQSQDVVAALELGANDYVVKPIDFQVLAARLRPHLELRTVALRKAQLAAAMREVHAELQQMVEELLAAQALVSVLPDAHGHALARIQAIRAIAQRAAAHAALPGGAPEPQPHAPGAAMVGEVS